MDVDRDNREVTMLARALPTDQQVRRPDHLVTHPDLVVEVITKMIVQSMLMEGHREIRRLRIVDRVTAAHPQQEHRQPLLRVDQPHDHVSRGRMLE